MGNIQIFEDYILEFFLLPNRLWLEKNHILRFLGTSDGF